MRAVPGPKPAAATPAAFSGAGAAGVTHSHAPTAARKPGHWLRGDGSQVPIDEMNEHHRAAAARKARASGDYGLAEELEKEGGR